MCNLERTLLISQLPLDLIGGGELFTCNSFEHLRNQSPDSELWYSSAPQGIVGFDQRMQQRFVQADFKDGKVVSGDSLTLRELLHGIYQFDSVAVHQYLSSLSTCDIIAAAAPDQSVTLTSLGHELVSEHFLRVYEPACNVKIVEISEFAAERACKRGLDAIAVAAGVSEKEITNARNSSGKGVAKKAVALGRLLPHKGFEVTLKGLPSDWSLDLVGPPSGDEAYEQLLAGLATANGKAKIHGYLPQRDRNARIQASDVLIASSTQTFYDGRQIDQAELFGLVLLEAIALGVLPVASDIPSFREIMKQVDLEELVYAERDADELKAILNRIEKMSPIEYEERVEKAQEMVRKHYTWETYWQRVLATSSKSELKTRAA